MSDPIAEFFDQLGHRRHERCLEEVTGTIRFDLTGEHGTGRWFVEISHGDLSVSRDAGTADCVMCADRDLFSKLATGETNFFAAWLRYQVILEGDTRLASIFAMTFPGPPGSRHPRDRGNAEVEGGTPRG